MAAVLRYLAIILVLQSHYVYADFNFSIPFLSPAFGTNACKGDVCGRGNCVVKNNTMFGFECECEQGWRQARDEDAEDFKFLPCVVPNCTLNYTCSDDAPSPAPYHDKRANFSFWDPCFWTDCGGGSCNKTSDFTHACECEEGYFNLFNQTTFPCYRECAIGADCANLGVRVTNSSSSGRNPGSTVAEETNSRAASLIPGVEFAWFSTLATTLALLFLKHA